MIPSIRLFTRSNGRMTANSYAHANNIAMPTSLASSSSSSSLASSSSSSSSSSMSKLGERVHTSVLACKHGTLSTLCHQLPSPSDSNNNNNIQGSPVAFGSAVNYIVDQHGAPIFRLDQQSIHALNIGHNPRVSLSLFPQQNNPAMSTNPILAEETILASVTLIGLMERVGEDDLTVLKAAYFVAHGTVNDDPNAENYLFYRLKPSHVHVCDNAVSCEAPTWVDMSVFQASTPNKLMLEISPGLPSFNIDKQKELARLYMLAIGSIDPNLNAEVIISMIESDGITLRLVPRGNHSAKIADVVDKKVLFGSKAHSVEDVKSEIVKLFQGAWESDSK